MPITNPGEASVRMDVSTGLNGKFDVIENCELVPRKSDVGVLQDEMKLTRRKGSSKHGTSHFPTYNTGTAVDGRNDIVFFTGVDGNRTAYSSYGGHTYKLVGIVWTEIVATQGKFDTVQLPYGNPSSTFTSSATATGIEKVKVDTVNDTNPINNVGKYLFITGQSSPTATQYNTTDKYRSKYAYVSGYDSTNAEYLLEGLGNADAVQGNAKYKIYDKLANYLQIYDVEGANDDRYYDGTAINSDFSGRIKQHFARVFSGISVNRIFSYDGYVWVHSDKSLFRSEAKNYFFFPITGAIEHAKFDNIKNVFVWKDKLIVGGNRSVVSYKRTELEGQIAYIPSVISNQYGIKDGGINDFDKDVYLLTTNNELISLVENQTGIVLPTNVGKPMMNYIPDFIYNVASGFDGRKFYLYGELVSGTTGTTIVYDTVGKFWSTFTGIPFSTIVQEGNYAYFTLNRDSRVLKFDSSATTDDGAFIRQVISTVPIDGGDPFLEKEFAGTYVIVENTTAVWKMYTHYSLNASNGTLNYSAGVDTRRYDGVSITAVSNTDYVTGVSMPIPVMLKKAGTKGGANYWKVTLVADGESTLNKSGASIGNANGPIELNEISVAYSIMKTDYVKTSHVF